MARLGRSFPATPIQFGAIASADNELVAVGTLSITGAALLTAPGSVLAAGTLSITGAADLDAAGTLAAAGALSITGAADLDAIGSLQAAGSIAVTGAADLDATGSLTATGTASISGAADLDATGSLAAAGALAINGAASLTGSLSDIGASGSLSITGSADLDAVGSIDAVGALSITGVGDLTSSASGTTPEADTGQTPAGRKRRRKRYFVEIDGQVFIAQDESHARAILDRAAELAVKAAEEQAQEITTKRLAKSATRKVVPVKIETPVITTDAPIDLAPYEKRIREAYQRAAELAELQLLFARQQALEDEEEALLLLM